jgi:hypothetical protein
MVRLCGPHHSAPSKVFWVFVHIGALVSYQLLVRRVVARTTYTGPERTPGIRPGDSFNEVLKKGRALRLYLSFTKPVSFVQTFQLVRGTDA